MECHLEVACPTQDRDCRGLQNLLRLLPHQCPVFSFWGCGPAACSPASYLSFCHKRRKKKITWKEFVGRHITAILSDFESSKFWFLTQASWKTTQLCDDQKSRMMRLLKQWRSMMSRHLFPKQAAIKEFTQQWFRKFPIRWPYHRV